MYIVNHFLDVDVLGILIPDRDHASTTNAVSGNGSITAQAYLCEGIYDRLPNFILLDFTDKGDPVGAQGGFEWGGGFLRFLGLGFWDGEDLVEARGRVVGVGLRDG
jgi:hypothetical protein